MYKSSNDEQLLSRIQVAQRLGMPIRTFSHYRPKLIANGLQPVKIGRWPKYRKSSVNNLIKKLAENDIRIREGK